MITSRSYEKIIEKGVVINGWNPWGLPNLESCCEIQPTEVIDANESTSIFRM